MKIRTLRTTLFIAALGAASPQAFGQDKTVAPADLEKAALPTLNVGFYMGSATIDRDSTNYRKMSKLRDDCKAKISSDIETSPPIATADMPNALLAVKQLFLDCMTKGIAADRSLATIRANVQFTAGK